MRPMGSLNSMIKKNIVSFAIAPQLLGHLQFFFFFNFYNKAEGRVLFSYFQRLRNGIGPFYILRKKL